MGPRVGGGRTRRCPASGRGDWRRGAPGRGAAGTPGCGPSSHPAPVPGTSPRSPHPSSQPPLHPHLSVSVPLLSPPLSFSPSLCSGSPCAHQRLPRLGFCSISARLHHIEPRWPQGPLPRWPDLVSHPSLEQEGELPPRFPAQPPAKPGPPACGQHAENGAYPYPPGSRGGGATLTGWELLHRQGWRGGRPWPTAGRPCLITGRATAPSSRKDSPRALLASLLVAPETRRHG